jgi:hypothetical protein
MLEFSFLPVHEMAEGMRMRKLTALRTERWVELRV